MKKTLLIAIITLLTAGFAINTAFAKPKKAQKKEVAIQLYSVRDLICKDGKYKGDYTLVLPKLAEMGYTAIEAANYDNGKFYGKTPEEFKKDIEAVGMRVLSSHTGKSLTDKELETCDFSESLAWWDKCIAAHKAAGMSYIVTPGQPTPKTLKDLKTYCDYHNEIGKRCKANGMAYGYHNHAYEFKKIEDKAVMLDYMIENTDPEYVFFELDVYWAMMGQACAVDYFNKYPGRFKLLHIKDLREIGKSGMVGFDAIFDNAKTAGVENIVVEVEQYSCDIEESVKMSLDYLLNAPFVKASYCK